MLKVILIEDPTSPVVFVYDRDDPKHNVDLCLCFTQEQVDELKENNKMREDVIWP